MSELQSEWNELKRKALSASDDLMSFTEREINRLSAFIDNQTRTFATERGKLISEAMRLTDELAAAKADEWTPITSAEQVEELATGQYQLKQRENNRDVVACKPHGKFWSILYSDGSASDSNVSEDIYIEFTSYKLIRAFEPSAPAIPEGAVLNTLENRELIETGIYYFQGSGHALYRKLATGEWTDFKHDWRGYSNSCYFNDFTHFTKTTEMDILAALEALAKENHSE